jgi:hypothetical protein
MVAAVTVPRSKTMKKRAHAKDLAEKERLAAQQAQEKIAEMATTARYEVDEATRKAAIAAREASGPSSSS